MRWKLTAVLLLTTFGCLNGGEPAPPPGAEGWGVLRGRVIDAYLRGPVADAVVGLRAGGPRVRTSEDGTFLFEGVAAGTHRVVMHAPGYLEGARAGVVVEAGGEAMVTALLFAADPALDEQERWLDRAAQDGSEDAPEVRADHAESPGTASPDHGARGTVGAARAALADPALPGTIRVWRSTGTSLVPSSRNGWADRSCDGRVEVLDLEEYVKGVIPHEWIPSWDREALRAGAIAARSYAASHALGGGRWRCADVDDGTVTQVYADDRTGPTDRAVEDTRGVVVVRDGRVVRTEYSAENGHPTAGHDIDDPVCSGSTLFGHGRGACQWGTQRWATGTCFRGACSFGAHGAGPKDYAWMMQHYFPGTTLSAGTPAAPCGTVPAEGGVVDDGGPCFDAYGPAAYWRTAAAGHGGGTHWTNAFQNETPGNWARWNLTLAAAGDYRVEVHIVDAFAEYAAARYEVRHGSATTEVVVDQGAADDGWLSLGSFAFAARGDQSVALFDNYASAVGTDQHLVADAIRLIAAPTGPPGPGPGRGETTDAGPPSLGDAEMPFAEDDGDDGGVPAAPRDDDSGAAGGDGRDPIVRPGADEWGGGCRAAGHSLAASSAAPWALMSLLLWGRGRRKHGSR